MALALYRKYRPRTFAEVIGQEHVTEPLSQALRSGRLHHAYLFSGPRGCGKTSSARILARSLNCEQGPTPEPCGVCASCRSLANDGAGSIDVIEIDAASHGGVDDARELREKAFFAPASSRYKIYVIDEAHMVSSAGFNALLKLVEEPPEYVKFIFATTEPEKVLGTIRSRTHHYPFRLIPPAVLRPYLQQLTEAEGVQVEPSVFPLVVRAGGGSARDTLSVLDQLIAGAGPEGVSYNRAIALLGVTDVTLLDEMCDAIAAGDGAAAYSTIDRVAEAGHDPRRFASDLLERFRDLIVLQQVPDAVSKGLIDGPADQLEAMGAQAARLGPATLSRCADIVHNGLVDMRGTTAPRLLLELITARMLLPGAEDSTGALLQRLERMERRLTLGGGELPPLPAGEAPAAAPAAPARPDIAALVRPDVPAPASGSASGGGSGLSAARAAAAAAARRAGSGGGRPSGGQSNTPPAAASAAPVSAAPASTAPGSSASVSAEPLSASPVPAAPVSAAPVSAAPVSAAPVSAAPVSAAPASMAPGSGAPVSAVPVSAVPAPAAPVSAAPASAAPVSAAPAGAGSVSAPPAAGSAQASAGPSSAAHAAAGSAGGVPSASASAGTSPEPDWNDVAAGSAGGAAVDGRGVGAPEPDYDEPPWDDEPDDAYSEGVQPSSATALAPQSEPDHGASNGERMPANPVSLSGTPARGVETSSTSPTTQDSAGLPEPDAPVRQQEPSARRSEPVGVLPDAPEEPGAAAVEAAAAGPGQLTAHAVRQVWPEVLAEVRKQPRGVVLRAMAADATVRELEGETLILTVPSPRHAQGITQGAALIVNALYEVLGGQWEIRCEVAGAAGGSGPGRGGPANGGRGQGRNQPAPSQRPDAAAQRPAAARAAAPSNVAPAGAAPSGAAQPAVQPAAAGRAPHTQRRQPEAPASGGDDDWPAPAQPGSLATAPATPVEDDDEDWPEVRAIPVSAPARSEDPEAAAAGDDARSVSLGAPAHAGSEAARPVASGAPSHAGSEDAVVSGAVPDISGAVDSSGIGTRPEMIGSESHDSDSDGAGGNVASGETARAGGPGAFAGDSAGNRDVGGNRTGGVAEPGSDGPGQSDRFGGGSAGGVAAGGAESPSSAGSAAVAAARAAAARAGARAAGAAPASSPPASAGGSAGAGPASAGGGQAGAGRAAAAGGGLAAARAAAAGARGPAGPRPAAKPANDAWSDGSPTEEAPYDPEFDGPPSGGAKFEGFDPGDEPLDEVIDEKTARESGEQMAMRLLQEAFGAEKIGES
ncbi:DNA polymerase III subunit gamma and tau [Actinoplanes sp. Pm04-4]|uniref:DNA-directed DNA polymerase n=1 Tax=Paractinoplanes pyxinae TaxID=2997416 RepID=A0ABT4B7M3_9ACTN|nr:DNA polymerase III subunit gamma and tau [Actinoplanes pyxinae]MCY1142506.1 DNA polymerase III subunit gamma and tau [Actinoplanes pyxinae]